MCKNTYITHRMACQGSINIFGMIALCGVVINGGLVFMVTANRYNKKDETPVFGAVHAAARRFRPLC